MTTSYGKKQKSPPSLLTQQKLERQALHYLERFSASEESLRRVLKRKIALNQRHHPTLDIALATGWAENLLIRFRQAGVINDVTYAEGRISTLRRRGESTRMIRERLRSKGVTGSLIDTALGDHAADMGGAAAAELAAAVAFARRRRLGPFRDNHQRDSAQQRDFAILARAGFSAALARTIMDAPDPAALEELIDQARQA
jgi:regulatory protein